ncbi:MAG: endonuclease/exonuclease/phosphatase family protein [Candidatus Omnitrophica bacterium]|nr:endonuclease/exonuclease/phosphatase family protein [Candidatus Omnitrophota bacterium]
MRYLCNYTLKDWPRYASYTTAKKPPLPPNQSIKVVSYNIKHGKKVNKALKLLKDNGLDNADIILAQELTPNAVLAISENLGYNYIYYPAILHPVLKQDFGNAIFSRWPILNDEKIILPHLKSRRRQRIAIKATVLINEKKVTVYSLHMGIFIKPDDRKRLVDIIIKPLPRDSNYFIIGGDFNSFTRKDRQLITEAFKDEGFDLASQDLGWTYKQWYLFNRKVALDHIFTKNMETVAQGKIESPKPSDHIPIWVDLNFLEN